jgi:hypothetical protein
MMKTCTKCLVEKSAIEFRKKPSRLTANSKCNVIPRSRGGSNDLNNLRFVAPEANASKHGMTDEELVSLCLDILKTTPIPQLIGRAILESIENETRTHQTTTVTT